MFGSLAQEFLDDEIAERAPPRPHVQTTPIAESAPDAGRDSRFCCNICLDPVVEPVATRCGHLYCWPCLYQWLEPGMLPEESAALTGRRSVSVNHARRVCPVCKAPCSVPTVVPIYVRDANNNGDSVPRIEASSESDVGNSGDAEEDSSDVKQEGKSDQGGNHTTVRHSSDESLSNSDHSTQRDESGIQRGLEMPTDLGSSFPTGIRRRSSADSAARERVPSRPSFTAPAPSSQGDNAPNDPTWMEPLSPNTHRASLSHGLLMSFQRQGNFNVNTRTGIPPLHRYGPDGERPQYGSELEAHPDSAEYLSRMLILLASFVIFCLLAL